MPIALHAPSRALPAPIDTLYGKTVELGSQHSVQNTALLVCLWRVCLRSKTWIKCWFSSQRWPISTKDLALVLHTVGMHLHAKFREASTTLVWSWLRSISVDTLASCGHDISMFFMPKCWNSGKITFLFHMQPLVNLLHETLTEKITKNYTNTQQHGKNKIWDWKGKSGRGRVTLGRSCQKFFAFFVWK